MKKSLLRRTWDRLNAPVFSPRRPAVVSADEPAAAPRKARSPKSIVGIFANAENRLAEILGGDRASQEASIKGLCNKSSITYACLQRYLLSITPIRWEVKKRVGDNKYEPVSGHPLERLLTYPNVHMTGGSMNRRITQHLLGPGNAYWRKQRGVLKDIVALYPMMPQLVAPVPDLTGGSFLAGYDVTTDVNTNAKTRLSATDVVHFMLEDPEDMFSGIGIVQANMATIESDHRAEQFWFNTIRKSVRKDGILSFKHDPTDEEMENWEDLLREEVIGAWNAGGVLLLGQEHTWTDLAKNAHDVDFIQARKMLRELIAAIFSVPPPMVGILDNSTYNNIQMARQIFWLDTLLPFLSIIAETWTRCLIVQEMKGDERYEYIIDYDVSSIEALHHVFGQRMDIALKMFKMGVDTVEIIRTLQLPISESAVRPYGFLPNNVRTVDTIIESNMKGESGDIFDTEVPQSIGRDQENPDAPDTPEYQEPDLYTRRGL